jgi:phage-related protein
VSPSDKPLVWLHGEIRTPPFSRAARIEAGYLLRLLQKGQAVGLPQSRPMPVVGPAVTNCECAMQRRNGESCTANDVDAVVILEVFAKKTRTTPKTIIDTCTRRLREYDRA